MPRYPFRASADDLAYGDLPERWDSERFSREREERHGTSRPPPPPPVMPRERPVAGYGRRVDEDHDRYDRRTRFDEKDRVFGNEHYGFPPRRRDFRYFEEDEVVNNQQMVPYERRRVDADRSRSRPGLFRRQSSLDTFDRKPIPRYKEPEVIPVPVPPRPRPRSLSRPRYPSPPRYVERDTEEVRISEPDLYGDDNYRVLRERERSVTRRRDGNTYEFKESERIDGDYDPARPYPRRGKTRIPRRLVSTRAIIELGYPFEEEGDTIIILQALGREQIDEIVNRSREIQVRAGETRTTYLIEPPPIGGGPGKFASNRNEIVDVPGRDQRENARSVHEWMRDTSPSSKSGHTRTSSTTSRTSRSTHGRGRVRTHTHRHRSTHRRREVHRSKSRSSRRRSTSTSSTSTSTSTSASSNTTARREIVIANPEKDESNTLIAGPLGLLPDRHRSERDIRQEIRALEREKEELRLERRLKDRGGEREIIIERSPPERTVVEVRKDRKGRMSLVRTRE